MHGRASYRLWLKEEYRYHTNDFKKTSFSFPFFVVCVCGGGGGVFLQQRIIMDHKWNVGVEFFFYEECALKK